jgi:hypothetical protein
MERLAVKHGHGTTDWHRFEEKRAEALTSRIASDRFLAPDAPNLLPSVICGICAICGLPLFS